MLTVAEVADNLRVSQWWVRDRVRKGVVTPLRVGDSLRAEMRFDDDHYAQLKASMQPAAPTQRTRRRRRT